MNSYVKDIPDQKKGNHPQIIVSPTNRSLESTMQNMTNIDEKYIEKEGLAAATNVSSSH